MQIRKDPLENGCCYHIFSRSIAKFVVFNNAKEYFRMTELLNVYNFTEFKYKYSRFCDLELEKRFLVLLELEKSSPKYVDIIAYCIMPTHFHLILRQRQDGGISEYMAKFLNSYSRFFNTTHRRTGPLWSGRFKSVLVSDDEQLLHLTRYIHLNPTSADLIQKPEDWAFSSFLEYINESQIKNALCNFRDIINITPQEYKKFVLDRKDYQRQISLIKNLLIDDYTG